MLIDDLQSWASGEVERENVIEYDTQPKYPSRADIDAAVGRVDELDLLLRRLALAAGAGVRDASETLLYAITSQGLAEPAIRRLVADSHDVDEVTQEVLIVIAGSVAEFRGESRFTTWVNGIARNKALELLRRQRPTEQLSDDAGSPGRISSIVADEVSIRDLVAQLPEPYRAAVMMRDVERLSYADVASRLGLKLNTVKAHIARGRALLAARLDNGGDNWPG